MMRQTCRNQIVLLYREVIQQIRTKTKRRRKVRISDLSKRSRRESSGSFCNKGSTCYGVVDRNYTNSNLTFRFSEKWFCTVVDLSKKL